MSKDKFQQNVDRTQSDTTGPDMDRWVSSIDHNLKAGLEPVADPQRTLYLAKRRLAGGEQLFTGRVLYAMPCLNWYLVQVGELKGSVACVRSESDSSSTFVGVIDTCVLPPDTVVLVAMKRNSVVGRIITTLPTQMTDGNQNFSDAVSQGSNVGVFRDGYVSQYITSIRDEGGVLNYCNSRPIDSLVGDWGKATYTGLAFHLDKDMFYARVSEICGVFGFYPQQWLRVAGHHLETITAGSYAFSGDDEGEILCYRGETPYPWESLGAFEFGALVHRQNTEKAVLLEKPEAFFEPVQDDLVPFHRYEEWGGYLGQGHIRQMQAPPKNINSQTLHRLSSSQTPITLWREHVGLDGTYSNVSAKSILLVKRPVIASVKRIKEHDSLQEAADNPENYKAAGQHGEGDEHKVGDPTYQGDNLLVTCMAILDGMVHELNWKSLLGFDYHEQDFRTQEEGEAVVPADFAGVNYQQLSSSWRMTTQPSSEEVKIDHRMLTKIYKCLSAFMLTDDGSLALTAGGGCELRFVGGEVYLSAPGSMFFQSGKGMYAIAGDDFVVKAHKSIDLTAANGDLRASAYKNIQACSAISGSGEFLLESKAQGKEHQYPAEGGEAISGSGITLKAAHSEVSTMSAGIYLRTGNDDIGTGNIVLDASKGDREIITVSSNFKRFLKGSAIDAFGFPKVDAVNLFTRSGCRLDGSAYIDGQVSLKGSLRAEQSVLAIKGSMQSRNGGQVGRILNPQVEQQVIDDGHQIVEDGKQSAHESYESDISQNYYQSQKIGEAEMQKKISFCFRSEADYGTDSDFELPMTLWQHLGQSLGGLSNFSEHEVEYQQQKFMPFPGHKAWTEQPKFLALPADALTMYDLAALRGKDRRADYEEAKYPQLERQILASNYKVISTP